MFHKRTRERTVQWEFMIQSATVGQVKANILLWCHSHLAPTYSDIIGEKRHIRHPLEMCSQLPLELIMEIGCCPLILDLTSSLENRLFNYSYHSLYPRYFVIQDLWSFSARLQLTCIFTHQHKVSLSSFNHCFQCNCLKKQGEKKRKRKRREEKS